MDPDLRDLLSAWLGRDVEATRRDELLARVCQDEAFRRSDTGNEAGPDSFTVIVKTRIRDKPKTVGGRWHARKSVSCGSQRVNLSPVLGLKLNYALSGVIQSVNKADGRVIRNGRRTRKVRRR